MNTQSTRCGLIASAKMDKLLLVFLATVALVTSDEDGSEVLVGSFELYSTPPSPPLPEGERAFASSVDPKKLIQRTQQVLQHLNSDLIVDEVFQLTHQLAQGFDRRFRSIFRATDGEVYKVVWTVYINAAGKWKLDGATLFHIPPEYPNDSNVIKSKKPEHTFQTAEKLFSTPPTPPKDGGERAQKPADTPKHRKITQGVLREAFDESDLKVAKVLLYTTQPITQDGVHTRVIFKGKDGQLYKVTWYLYRGHQQPYDVVGAVLFKVPPNYPTDDNVIWRQDDKA